MLLTFLSCIIVKCITITYYQYKICLRCKPLLDKVLHIPPFQNVTRTTRERERKKRDGEKDAELKHGCEPKLLQINLYL
ncbi:hypothetical protein OnM2_c2664o17 [Erysiphe neolycopersici]|uniref:Secreted protein n=1 Tax=Erysiphe neolycopersici TaxID=212602 RepID=A0A420HZ60_9PEZI|nr:hypothetical protein OnM2_c2664o17 [Erysiphe neolycopersici]